LQSNMNTVVDFSKAISKPMIISKGSTLCHAIVEADNILPSRHGTTSASQSRVTTN